MRPLVLLCLCVLAAVAAACGTGATTNCKAPPDRDLLLAIREHARVEGRPVKLPTSTTRGNAGRLTISACQTSSTEATATLTVFSLSDDSTRDIRHGMKLERRGTTWTVTGDAHTRRCHRGRGNQEFSSQKCR
ncbi:MAG TPA: hypothetical protein VG474_16390 [Solirubrobacteraceae bacterium]|nr:hypothetical protein [Solirubrobacteraceae bacterium]